MLLDLNLQVTGLYFSSGIHFSKLSLGQLQYKIDRGILDPEKITMFDLVSQQIVKMPNDYTGIQLDIQASHARAVSLFSFNS